MTMDRRTWLKICGVGIAGAVSRPAWSDGALPTDTARLLPDRVVPPDTDDGELWLDDVLDGAELASAPSAIADASGTTIYVRAIDDTLHELRCDAAHSEVITSVPLGAIARSAPSAVAVGGGRRMVFFRGEDGYLGYVALDGQGPRRAGPVSLGALAPGIERMPADAGPAAFVADRDTGDLLIFFRGESGVLWTVTWTAGRWSAAPRSDVILRDTPAPFEVSSGEIHLFYRGPDSCLWVTSYQRARRAWKAPEHMGANYLHSAPSAVAVGRGDEFAVYYRGANRTLWFTHWPDVPGGRWWSAPRDTTLGALDPAVTSLEGPEVYYRGNDRLLHVLYPSTDWLRAWRGVVPRAWPTSVGRREQPVRTAGR